MEQIYTIPINEVFEEYGKEKVCECPMCALEAKLEENELSLILGASMMEPDVRIETNRRGFCRSHYDKMYSRGNRLGLALILESHLAELEAGLRGGGLASLMDPSASAVKKLESLDGSCYICNRIEFHLAHMFETVALLYERDPDFLPKFKSQSHFCLSHYRRLLKVAKDELPKKKYAAFYADASEIENAYVKMLCEDVSWFCKKFDYRYAEEPWYNAKDSVERSIRFLGGEGEVKKQ